VAVKDMFWIVLELVKFVADQSVKAFTPMQGKTTTVEQQQHYIDKFQLALQTEFGIEDNVDSDEESESDDESCWDGEEEFQKYATSIPMRHFRMKIKNIVKWFTHSCSSWTEDLAAGYTLEQWWETGEDLGWRLTVLVDKLSQISVERDSENRPTIGAVPSVLPAKVLSSMNGRDFREMVSAHHDRYSTKFSEDEVLKLEDQFIELSREYKDSDSLKARLECTEDTAFETAWEPIATEFPIVYDFFGSLATIFPGTATVEADFSALKWSKNRFSAALSDLSLEAKLQCKQWDDLHSIDV
jgi:hypothetical protein